jgi:hypothetical protein
MIIVDNMPEIWNSWISSTFAILDTTD